MDYAIFWPGYLSMAWMAGIILAFACHLQLYPPEKGRGYLGQTPREGAIACLLFASEVGLCLNVLAGMSRRLPLARNCHVVLSDLHQTIQRSMHSSTHSPSVRGRPFTPGSTSQTNHDCPQVAESDNNSRVNSLKWKWTDYGAQTDHRWKARLGGFLPQMNVHANDIDRQFDPPRTSESCEPRPAAMNTDGRTSITSVFSPRERTGLNY